jgi:hypothetical protein
MKKLLKKDKNLELNNNKWFKNKSEGEIEIKDQIYNLVVTDNKRKLKYYYGKFLKTEPYVINEENDIINKD